VYNSPLPEENEYTDGGAFMAKVKSELCNLLVVVDSQNSIEVKDFKGITDVPDHAVQLDELLYHLIDDGILDPKQLTKLIETATKKRTA
jgi:hypothetical protein